MGGTISSKIQAWRGKEEMKLLMVGLDAAGKTTILYRIAGNVDVAIPTIGFNVETASLCAGKRVVSFTAWDVGGRDRIRPLWRHYYAQINCLAFVVDSNDIERVEDAADQLRTMLREEELAGCPLLVYANKKDLPGALSSADLAGRLGLHGIRDRLWYIVASSGQTGEGIFDGLEWLTRQMEQRRDPPQAPPRAETRAALPRKSGPPSIADTATTADVDDLDDAAAHAPEARD